MKTKATELLRKFQYVYLELGMDDEATSDLAVEVDKFLRETVKE